MLAHYCAGVDSDDVKTGEGQANGFHCLSVEVWLTISGHDDSTIDDDKVGVSGGQTQIVLINGVGHGKSQKTIGASVGGAEIAQLLFQRLKITLLLVALIVASHINQCVAWGETHDGVDVAVGVVAHQRAVIEPKHACGMQAAQ